MEDETADPVDDMCAEISAAFPDVDTDIFRVTGRVLVLAGRLGVARDAALAEFGLSQADYDVLATLARAGPRQGLNPGTLRRSVTLSSGGLSKRLDRLETSGLVSRSADPHDRRGVIVRLSRKGRQLFERALPAVLAADSSVAGTLLSRQEIERMRGYLSRMLIGGSARAESHQPLPRRRASKS